MTDLQYFRGKLISQDRPDIWPRRIQTVGALIYSQLELVGRPQVKSTKATLTLTLTLSPKPKPNPNPNT